MIYNQTAFNYRDMYTLFCFFGSGHSVSHLNWTNEQAPAGYKQDYDQP